ncbi:hypothetical protein [Limnospira platensis]|uniref:hypothetical protein n=1 Tax=Limnospira platensis TaxID=118562 RepID=UPI003D6EB9A1
MNKIELTPEIEDAIINLVQTYPLSEVAKQLGISRTTLYRLIRESEKIQKAIDDVKHGFLVIETPTRKTNLQERLEKLPENPNWGEIARQQLETFLLDGVIETVTSVQKKYDRNGKLLYTDTKVITTTKPAPAWVFARVLKPIPDTFQMLDILVKEQLLPEPILKQIVAITEEAQAQIRRSVRRCFPDANDAS